MAMDPRAIPILSDSHKSGEPTHGDDENQHGAPPQSSPNPKNLHLQNPTVKGMSLVVTIGKADYHHLLVAIPTSASHASSEMSITLVESGNPR
jgi:hypothetical protein